MHWPCFRHETWRPIASRRKIEKALCYVLSIAASRRVRGFDFSDVNQITLARIVKMYLSVSRKIALNTLEIEQWRLRNRLDLRAPEAKSEFAI
jgi:hypothetical protein